MLPKCLLHWENFFAEMEGNQRTFVLSVTILASWQWYVYMYMSCYQNLCCIGKISHWNGRGLESLCAFPIGGVCGQPPLSKMALLSKLVELVSCVVCPVSMCLCTNVDSMPAFIVNRELARVCLRGVSHCYTHTTHSALTSLWYFSLSLSGSKKVSADCGFNAQLHNEPCTKQILSYAWYPG